MAKRTFIFCHCLQFEIKLMSKQLLMEQLSWLGENMYPFCLYCNIYYSAFSSEETPKGRFKHKVKNEKFEEYDESHFCSYREPEPKVKWSHTCYKTLAGKSKDIVLNQKG